MPIHALSLVDEAAQHGLTPGAGVLTLRFTDGLGVAQVYRYRYAERALSTTERVQREGLHVASLITEQWDGVSPVSFLKGAE